MDFNKNGKNDINSKQSYSDKYVYSCSNKKKFKRKTKNRLFIIGIIISLIIGIIGSSLIYAYKKLDLINYKPLSEQETSDTNPEDLLQESMVLNIALFGIDRRTSNDNHSRSDSSMILSLDGRRKKIKLTSLMRDTWVEIPGHNSNRLNTAIAFGGESLAIKTIQENFGIKIDRYATVDFESFKVIVDIIGGIDMSLSAKEAAYINGDLLYYKSNSELLPVADGVYHLDGEKTLSYSRARKVATPEGLHDDYARTYRQRRVLSIIVEKMKTCNLNQILNVIEKAGPYISTNLKKSEILSLSKNALTYLNYKIEDFRIPTNNNVKGQNINGMEVLIIPDKKKARYDLAKFIYEDSVKE